MKDLLPVGNMDHDSGDSFRIQDAFSVSQPGNTITAG